MDRVSVWFWSLTNTKTKLYVKYFLLNIEGSIINCPPDNQHYTCNVNNVIVHTRIEGSLQVNVKANKIMLKYTILPWKPTSYIQLYIIWKTEICTPTGLRLPLETGMDAGQLVYKMCEWGHFLSTHNSFHQTYTDELPVPASKSYSGLEFIFVFSSLSHMRGDRARENFCSNNHLNMLIYLHVELFAEFNI